MGEHALKNKLGNLFDLEFDLLLYDVTSTYFEGQCNGNPLAKHGHSRDRRSDCKQVCIGLVVTKEGIPLGYEVFAGNTHDSKTYQKIIRTMEAKYGKADRIWCSDRGMTSEENIAFLKQEDRKFIIGTAKSKLRNFERELLADDWNVVREGLEVKLCPREGELFVLCRSTVRPAKQAMGDRFHHPFCGDGLAIVNDQLVARLPKDRQRLPRVFKAQHRRQIHQVQIEKGHLHSDDPFVGNHFLPSIPLEMGVLRLHRFEHFLHNVVRVSPEGILGQRPERPLFIGKGHDTRLVFFERPVFRVREGYAVLVVLFHDVRFSKNSASFAGLSILTSCSIRAGSTPSCVSAAVIRCQTRSRFFPSAR